MVVPPGRRWLRHHVPSPPPQIFLPPLRSLRNFGSRNSLLYRARYLSTDFSALASGEKGLHCQGNVSRVLTFFSLFVVSNLLAHWGSGISF